MIVFLYGQDTYGLIQYVNQMIARYQKKYPASFNLHRFDLEEDNPDEIKNAIRGNSFFSEIKFVVIKNPIAKPAIIEKMLKENNIAEEKDTVLLLYQSGPEKNLKEKNEKFFNLLKKEAQLKEFKPPTIHAANKFEANYLTKHKISLKKEVLTKLVKETGSDFWRLKNELDKITSFTKTENKKTIDEDNLIRLTNFKIDQNIFNIVDTAFSNQGRAMVLFNDYLNQGGDPLYLLSMIAFQLKNMLIVRELIEKKYQYAQILKRTGMHPFFFKKNYEVAQKYPLHDLKKIFQRVVDFEVALKTGKTEPENIFFKIFL